MARGDGRIYTQPASSYFWISYYHNGKEIRELARYRTGKKKNRGAKILATEENRKAAEAFLVYQVGRVKEEKDGGRAFIGPQQARLTIDELLDSLERDYRQRNKWNPKVASNVKPLRESFGSRRAVTVTSDAIGKYIEQLREDGYSNATVNRRTQLLGQSFKLALRTKKLTSAPYIPHLSEVGNERQGFLETEHLDSVIQHLPEYLRDFVQCDFLIGWRKGALESLRWTDVTEDVIYLRAKNSKTCKPESLPLEGELRDIVERRRAAAVWQSQDGQGHFSEYVFHDQGRPIGDFRKAWATACCAAGVGKRVCRGCRADVDEKHRCAECGKEWKREELKYTGALFHDFRRTAARNLVRAGVPVPVAMKITGHRTDSMFRRYAIVNEEQKREALAKTQIYLAQAAARKVIPLKVGRRTERA